MPERLPHPGPSFLKEHDVRIGDRVLRAGMNKPVDGPDDWWNLVTVNTRFVIESQPQFINDGPF